MARMIDGRWEGEWRPTDEDGDGSFVRKESVFRDALPVLWDSHTDRIVNNESSEVMRILDAVPSEAPRLSPPERRAELDAFGASIYDTLNNGVYRAGFATSQAAYDEAVQAVFQTLDRLEAQLQGRDWFGGDRIGEADLRVFVTLFKCNLRRIADHPNLQAFLQRVYRTPGVAETCDLPEVRKGYASIRAINPHGIVPAGPPVEL